jgi:hypothetical protein
MTMPEGPAAGWYQDPVDQALLRYWDGSAWTDQSQPRPLSPSDPATTEAPPAWPPPTTAGPPAWPPPTPGPRRRRLLRSFIIAAVAVAVLAVLGVTTSGGGDKRGNNGTTWFAGGVPGSWRPFKLINAPTADTKVLYSWATSSDTFGSQHLHPTCIVGVIDTVLPSGARATTVLATLETGLRADSVHPRQITLADGAPALQVDTQTSVPASGSVVLHERDILAVFGARIYDVDFTTSAARFATDEPTVAGVLTKFLGASRTS